MLMQPLARGERMFRDPSNQPTFASPGFLCEYGDSYGPQSITFGSCSRSSYDHGDKPQMSYEAAAAIGPSTPSLYDQNSPASWKQRKDQTNILGSVSSYPQAVPFLEQEAHSGSKAAERNTELPLAGVQSHDASSSPLVTVGNSPSPTSRRRLHDHRSHEPSPITEQTTGFSAQGTSAVEVKNEGEKLRGGHQSREPGQKHSDGQAYEIPLDPNLVCPKCGQPFRHGEIQRLKLHFKRCGVRNQ